MKIVESIKKDYPGIIAKQYETMSSEKGWPSMGTLHNKLDKSWAELFPNRKSKRNLNFDNDYLENHIAWINEKYAGISMVEYDQLAIENNWPRYQLLNKRLKKRWEELVPHKYNEEKMIDFVEEIKKQYPGIKQAEYIELSKEKNWPSYSTIERRTNKKWSELFPNENFVLEYSNNDITNAVKYIKSEIPWINQHRYNQLAKEKGLPGSNTLLIRTGLNWLEIAPDSDKSYVNKIPKKDVDNLIKSIKEEYGNISRKNYIDLQKENNWPSVQKLLISAGKTWSQLFQNSFYFNTIQLYEILVQLKTEYPEIKEKEYIKLAKEKGWPSYPTFERRLGKSLMKLLKEEPILNPRVENLTGKHYNRLTVDSYAFSLNGNAYWLCSCECDNKNIVSTAKLKNGHTKSCGCLKKVVVPSNSKNLIGQKFNKLTVISKSDKRTKNGNVYWNCECECGNFTEVTTAKLTSGSTKSCGCIKGKTLSDEQLKDRGKKVKSTLTEKGYFVDGTALYALNDRPPKNNTSGVRGVTWDKSKNKWIAQIEFQGKHIFLGRYEEKEGAIHVRKEAEKKYFDPIKKKYDSNQEIDK